MGSFGSIRTTTIREFDGGLNVVHDDLNMSTSYSTIETNMFNSKSGTKSKRYGTKYFTDISKVVTKTISCSYKVVEKTLDYFYRAGERYFQPESGDTVHFVNTKITETPTITSISGNYITIANPTSQTLAKDDEVKIYISNDSLTVDANYVMTTTVSSIDTENSTITLLLKNFVTPSYSLLVGRSPKYFLISDVPDPICEITDEYFVSWNRDYRPLGEHDYTFYSSKSTKDVVTARNWYASTITTTKQNFIYIICDVSEFRRNMEVTISGDDTVAGTYSIYYLDDKGIYLKTDLATTLGYKTISVVYEPDKVTGDYIVNCTYYKDKIIAVTNAGEVVAIDGTGNKKVIWNDTIQSEVTAGGEGSSWNGTTFVCFAVFDGKLTIWNGISKPLVVNFNVNEAVYPCNYLRDGASDVYTYVPIAKYALGFNHYLICANIFDENEQKQYSDRIAISAKDAIGTFYSGDTTDLLNDSVYLDLGTIISANKQDIKGLARYRDKVCVGFDELCLFGTLGNYTEQTITQENTETVQEIHDPQFETVISNHGCISNRTFGTFNSDLICLDYSGLPLFRLAQFSTQILPARISTQITPEIYKAFINLKESTIEDRVFSVMNPKDNQYLLFIPNSDDRDTTTETVCYAYTMSNDSNPSPLQGAWSKFTGWNFDCGCTSALNEVFLCHGTKIYTLGNSDNPVYSDYYEDPDYPPEDEEDISGKAIDFEWELPWADFGDRAATKHSRYLSVSSTGTAKFTVDYYLDYIYTNYETGERDPQLSMEFVGGDSVGYGNGKQLYGGSRRTNSEFLFAYPAKYKIAKFNIHGSSKYQLDINSITIYYQVGNIRR